MCVPQAVRRFNFCHVSNGIFSSTIPDNIRRFFLNIRNFDKLISRADFAASFIVQSDAKLIRAGLLLEIALIYTYLLTPQMSALGMNLTGDFLTGDLSAPLPQAMGYLHGLYWGLEVVKLLAAGWLVKLCYRDVAAVFE